MTDDSPIGVYSKSWLKFTENELYLPEEVIESTQAYKTNQHSIQTRNTVGEKVMFDIYPNPASEYITVGMGTYEINDVLHVEIINSTGNLVLEKFHNANGIINMNTERLPSGMYVVRISDGESVIQNKMIEIIK